MGMARRVKGSHAGVRAAGVSRAQRSSRAVESFLGNARACGTGGQCRVPPVKWSLPALQARGHDDRQRLARVRPDGRVA